MDRDREAFEAWCKEIVGVARDLDAACERLAAGRSQNAYDAMIEGGQANDLLALDRARKAVREVIAAPMPPAPDALAYVRGERECRQNAPLEEVGTTDRGYTIFREVNEVGGHRYWSDEIGGGVCVWDTCLADAGTLRECLRIEEAATPSK